MIFRNSLSVLFVAITAPAVMALPPQVVGYNVHGQLGDGTLSGRSSPVLVQSTQVFPKLAGGSGHSLGVTASGEVWAWGNNASGQLGDGTLIQRNNPTAVLATGVLADRTVQAIATQGDSSYALLDDGTVAAWGNNLDAELGDGTTVDRPAPVLVSGLTGATAIGAGRYHALTVIAGGAVRTWGYNGQGQLGDNSTALRQTPVPVSGLANATAVAGGDYHSVALLQDGSLRAWGFNGSGQLGDNTTVQRKIPVPVSGLIEIVQIAAGASHTVARKSDGTVWTWGENGDGQLGLGDTNDRHTPNAVPGITTAIGITAAGAQTLVLLADGTFRSFGDNAYGQLGDGTLTDRVSPVNAVGLVAGTALASGRFHSFFVAPITPSVSIGTATSVNTTSVTLNGTINPRENVTTAKFEYGLTTNFGNSVDVVLTPNDGSTAQAVSATVNGLEPGRAYVFRLSATNLAGTVNSTNQAFSTRALYAQWKIDMLGNENAPDDGDPDSDGLKNIVEYLTGSNPTQTTILPSATIVNDRLTLTFPRATGARDVTVTIQASDNLTQWTDIAASDRGAVTASLVEGVEVSESGTGPVVTVEVRDRFTVTDPAHPRRFMRLQVTK